MSEHVPVGQPTEAAQTSAGPLRRAKARRELPWILLIVLFTVFSRAPFVIYEALHFDSDQAVVGLMAMHLTQGKGFTVFMYGNSYLATIEPYLAAPLFIICGPSRWALKLPLVVVGAVTAILIYVALRKDAAASPRTACLLALPFALPSVLMACQLVRASGANAEPFLWVILLWLLRRRPVAAGFLAGFAIQNRALCATAVCSLWLLMFVVRQWRLVHHVFFALAGAAAFAAVELLARFAMNHPVVGPQAGLSSPAEILFLTKAVFSLLLPLLYALKPTPISQLAINSDVIANPSWLACLPLIALALFLLAALTRPNLRAVKKWQLPCYLMLTGLLTVAAYILLQGGMVVDRLRARYLLLTLFFLLGAAAFLCQTRRRRIAVAALLLWTGANFIQSTTLWLHTVRHPPQDVYADLAATLRGLPITAAMAKYWTAYYVTFLLEEQIPVTSSSLVRIPEYHEAFRAAEGKGRAWIVEERVDYPTAIRVHHWYICPEPYEMTP